MVFNKDNKKEISAIEDLIKAKIYVNPKRFEELSTLRDEIWSQNLVVTGESCTLLCFNLSPAVEDRLRSLEGYTLQVEHITEDKSDPSHKEDRKRFLKVFAGKRLAEGRVAAIVHELSSEGDQLSLLDRRVIALSLLNKLPVVALTSRCPDPLPAASDATGDTWPVFFVPHPHEDMRPVCTWLAEELPRVRSLSGRIEEELQGRVAHLGKVSAPLHFLSRASVALVPFGVMTVNFLGILRLMANMLQCVGMRGDSSANRALGLLGAKSAAFVTAIDSMGDVYSFAVFSTVLADLQGLGLVEAAAAMDVLDGLMLGSISVVTGAVSALGAYLSRPIVVRAAAEFLASLQTIHVLNPAMRRETERRAKGGKGARKGKGGRKSGGRRGRGKEGAEEGEEEEEELRLLLQRSERKSGLRRPGSAAGVVAASAAAAVAAAEEGCGVREGPSGAVASAGGEGSFPLEEEAQGGASSSAPDEGSDGDSDGDGDGGEEEEEDDSTEGEEQVSGAELEQGPLAAAADAAADAGVGVERGSGGAEQEPVTAAPGAGAVSAAKLSRAEKKTQALASRQAAREAKAAAAAAKAAAKAEAKAAALEERQCKRQEKQQQREQRAAAKAAAKARGPALELAVQGGGAGGMAQRAAAIGVGGGDGAAAAPGAAAAKEPWWRRRKASTATAREGGDGAPQEGVTREGAVGAAGERSSDSGSGSSSGTADGAAGGGEQNDKALRKRLEASLSRKARLGLDEETCRGLMDFLDLPDEEVYGGSATQPEYIG
ncbi:hypothetical protein PLESTF_000406300 [Pleodorina starrii]|nr:hypothetical protein PLESTM_001448100 [Pleodorina starrii]GLC66274.1 hypothetical protein PLESTF_000406300 [Pleodorina starrii]